MATTDEKVQLPQKIRNKFYGNMLQVLRTCTVVSGVLEWDGDRDSLSRLVQLEQQHLHKWVNRYSVLVELFRRAQTLVSEAKLRKETDSAEGLLLDILGNEALEALATETVDFLSGVPYKYEYWAQLRGIAGVNLAEPMPVGQILTLTHATDIQEPKGLGELMMAMGVDRDFNLAPLKTGDAVLHIRVSGYSSGQASDSAPAFALSIVKEFVALSEVSGFLIPLRGNTDRTTTGLLTELPHDPGSSWVNDIPVQVLKHVDRYCLDRRVTHRIAGLFDLNSAEQVQRTEAETRREAKSHLERIGRVFSLEPDKHSVAIRTAAQWYFDATAESNETNAFLFTSLGLEALLGGPRNETESVGLKRLLGNRLAYLLAGKRSDRDRLIEDFDKFYGIRSELVHGREQRVGYTSRQSLEDGKRWLKLALSKELTLI